MPGLTPDDLYLFRWVDHVRLGPGGRLAFQLAWADAGARDNRSRISIGSSSTEPVEVTAGRRDRSPEWSPDGRSLAFASTRGAREQLFVLPLEGGEARQLTDRADGASTPLWAPDGSRIAFLGGSLSDPDGVVDDPRPAEVEEQGRRRPVARIARRLDYKHDGSGYVDGRHRHLFVVDAGEAEGIPEARQLTDGPWSVEAFDWAPDGARWAVAANAEPDADLGAERHLYVVDAAGGRRRLTEGLVVSTPAWSPRGDLIAFVSPLSLDGGRHDRVWVVPAAGGEARCLTREFDQNVGGSVISDMRAGHGTRIRWSDDGERIYFVAAGPGIAEVCSVDLEGAVRTEIASPHRVIYDFDLAGGTIAFAASNPWTPGDLWLLRDGVQTRLSEFNPWLRDRDLAIPEKHVFRAPDGMEIEGWLLRPPGATTGGPLPLVLEIHGGPHGQYGWTLFHEFQVLAGMGLQVLALNPRGSDGRGEEFKRAVVGDWGGRDFDDLMSALDQLIERTGMVDRDRLGIGGGSYGGYMTNWAIGHTTRFKAAVSMRSISNLVSWYAKDDVVPWARIELGPEPWPDPDQLWRRSPIRHVRNIRTPLLLTHGEMDLRCGISQAEELFGALRLLGRPVEMVRFPGESHDLSRNGRPDRRVERLTRIAAWFGRHLLDSAPASAEPGALATSPSAPS